MSSAVMERERERPGINDTMLKGAQLLGFALADQVSRFGTSSGVQF